MLAQDQVAVVVVDAEGRLSGIATDRDLLKQARDGRSRSARTASGR